MPEIKIINGMLEDDKETGQIILRGVIDQSSLKFIKLDWYQREQGFSNAHTQQIVSAYFQGQSLEDLTCGMRGEKFRSKGTDFVLLDPVYCMNGGQRLFASGLALRERPDTRINLGIKLYFSTNEKFENDMFCKLGTSSVRISSSVLLRNKKKESKAAALLVRLNSNPKFALKERVSWDQKKSRHELMTGTTLSRVAGMLHAHKGTSLKSSKPYELLGGLDNLIGKIGEENFTTNMIRFFDVIDSCWSVRQLVGDGDPRPHLRVSFLITLAKLFSAYSDFWDGRERNEFYFPTKFHKRLRTFRLSEYIQPGRVSREMLYEFLRKRLNLNPIFEEDAEAAE